jgi:hypothetical protein
MKCVAAALWLLSLSAQVASAAAITGAGGVGAAVVRVDWQYSWQLPPRFRNHCTYEYFTARPFCSDHCGGNYQFYYCSAGSFGCCHLGRGYCDVSGLLRCIP